LTEKEKIKFKKFRKILLPIFLREWYYIKCMRRMASPPASPVLDLNFNNKNMRRE